MDPDFLDHICGEDGKLDPDCFIPAQEFVFQIIENKYEDSKLIETNAV